MAVVVVKMKESMMMATVMMKMKGTQMMMPRMWKRLPRRKLEIMS